ncbi:related to permease of the major facilitator superfamily [Rhynchosporium secalis]|uniref:Related to permease of the major facilitator superfamily n=1 Tax=Rhynchosporium secalis TaxID=38038 RepID=A0A1E1LVC9_RHYSE|nr:related to permease of the major facilitator superfamily [Rhynchosporium secalis]
MGQPPENHVSTTEKPKVQETSSTAAPKTIKTGVAVNEQATPGQETLPGWTSMRPLRMRGLNNRDSNGATNSNGNANAAGVDDRKGNFNTTQTNVLTGSDDGSKGADELGALHEIRSDDELLGSDGEAASPRRGRVDDGTGDDNTIASSETVFKVYKRRWFGLVQLVLLNIIVSWDWLTFSANSTTAAEYYNVKSSSINWISTAFLFSFVVASPVVVYTLHRGGPKTAIIIASVLLLVGNWIRYGATKAGKHGNFGGLMFGQILIGLSQPFVLSAPTRYSDLWFTNQGRVGATALMSLANPLGGALAQLIGPAWVSKASDIPSLVLYVSIIATAATIPSFFITAKPPTPSSHSGTQLKHQLRPSLQFLLTCPEFYMIMIPYAVYVGLFNSISSLINQMLQPYSFTEDEAGIGGALLIVVGLVTSAITSPIIDRTKSYLLAIKICVPIIAIMYLAFIWAPQTRAIVGPYVILSILGAASFGLVPIVLEFLIEVTHPVAPEVTSTICWTGGQLLGGIFILVSDALREEGANDGTADDESDRPPGNMYKTLIFQAVLALVVVPLPLALGLFGRQQRVRMRRVDADREAAERRYTASGGEVAV